jgi:uncharacterized membrane protein
MRQLGDMNLLEMDKFTKRWLIIILTIVLALGVFFRVSNLDVKPIWAGEADTFAVISGYSTSEVIDRIATVGVSIDSTVNIGSFLKYQYPNSEKNLGDTIHKLYSIDQTPLYFLLARYWVELFGYSVTTLRSFSAVLSLLALPCIYWLCLELFGLPLVGWMAVALLSVSPIQVIYAQEADSSSLLILIVLLSGSALLWALRTQKKVAWFTYMVSIVLGLYTQYLFLFVAVGYLIYVLSIESFRFTPRLRWFYLTTFLSFLAFLPWIAFAIGHVADFTIASSWKNQNHLTIPGAIALWVENISLSFIDLVDPKATEYMGFGKFDFYLLTPPIVILVAYSIYLLRFRTSKQVYLFVFITIGSTALPLIIIDLVLGRNQQIFPKNLFPCLLGIQISVAYLLSSQALFLYQFKSPSRQIELQQFGYLPSIRLKLASNFAQRSWYGKVWSAIAATIITVGIIFCLIIVQADTWWNKYGGEDILSFTQLIHPAQDSLLVVNKQRPESIIFYNLQPEVRLLFMRDKKLKVDSFTGAGNIFLLNPNLDLQAELKLHNYQLNLLAEFPNPDRVYDLIKPPQLWKLRKSTD